MAEKVWTKEEIHQLITTDARWTTRAICALYDYQTDDEVETRSTKHHNQVGFNGIDAGFLTDLALQAQSGRTLSEKQIRAAQRIIGKYAGQLLRIIAAKSAAKTAEVARTPVEFHVIWPENRVVTAETITGWYRDAVANEELSDDGYGKTDPVAQSLALHRAGLITLKGATK